MATGHDGEAPPVVVIGAGLSGLCAAGRLRRAGRHVVVVERSLEPGGRLATRRLDDAGTAVADDGAQFFTVREPAFRDLTRGWPVTVWHHGPARASAVTDAPTSVRSGGDGHPRFAAHGGMAAIARHLARGLDVRLGTCVRSVTPAAPGARGHRWDVMVQPADGGPITRMPAGAVVVTTPVPLAVGLVEVPLPADVTGLRYDPCVSVLAVLDSPSGLPEPGAVQFDGGPVRHLADNARKGISARPTLTVHASADWSQDHADATDDAVAQALLDLVEPWTRSATVHRRVTRWRHATPVEPHPERAVAVAVGLVLAGDAFGGPKVEGAALSGLAAADLLG